MTFAACLPVILANEGGFVDNPHDPGGATNHGITLATYSAWLARPATVDELKAIGDRTVAALYERDYYYNSGADLCPAGVDLMVFDAAVNSGCTRAIIWLQQALGVKADSAIGPVTRAALAKANPVQLITLMKNLRLTFVEALPNAADFPGWRPRIEHTAAAALAMATEQT